MTITYTGEVATSKGISCFLKLLKRWRGSIYKLIWLDLIIFLSIYYVLDLSYAYVMDDAFKRFYVKIVKYCHTYGSLIPLSFVLGFYVNLVYSRWWSQYTSIPFPDNLAILVGASIKGRDERARIIRRTIVRYSCLAFTWTLTLISGKVKKRFPTLQHFVTSGLLTEEEKHLLEDVEDEFPAYSKTWLPLAWAANVTTRARHEGFIKDDHTMEGILDHINAFRSKCGSMLDYDWISIPLVYTQVVTLAVYSYFLVTVIGTQITSENDSYTGSLISFPFMQILEFVFYMGWLKVAECLINPYGEDDDDFEVMWMIDRHLQVCYLLVDRIHQQHPELCKDLYWNEVAPKCLPYTIASQDYISECQEWSTTNIEVKNSQQDLIMPDYVLQPDAADSNKNRKYSKQGGMVVRDRKRKRDIPLHRVSVQSLKSHETDRLEEFPHETRNVMGSNLSTNYSHTEDFETLRQKRLQERKEKLLRCIELLKSSKGKERDILNDILG